MIGNLYVQQNFTGLNENSNNELSVDVKIEANLPTLNADEQVIYPDFSQDYEYRSNQENPDTKKVIESKGSIEYKTTTVREPNQFKNYRIEHSETVHFSVCNELNEEKLAQASALVKLSTKKMFVTFVEGERLVRFTSANFIRSLDDPTPNPCDLNDCSPYAECVPDEGAANGYYCQCKAGFDGEGRTCEDINECTEGSTHCSVHAECINLLGHYACKCIPPREGDGRSCDLRGVDDNRDEENENQQQEGNYNNNNNQQEDICSRCDPNARCVYDDYRGINYCRCNPGYSGNGQLCELG